MVGVKEERRDILTCWVWYLFASEKGWGMLDTMSDSAGGTFREVGDVD